MIALGQSLAIGFRALTDPANASSPEDVQLSSTARWGSSMGVAVVLFVGIFVVGPARRSSVGCGTSRRLGLSGERARGRVPGGAVPRLPRGDRTDEGHPTGLPVSRRRAQDDRRIRARRAARPRARGPLLHAPRAVWHELPADRHGAHDPGVRVLRDPVPVADRIAHHRDPHHRRDRLRAAQARRPVPERSCHAGGDDPRAVASEDHDQASRPGQIEVAIASFKEVLRRKRKFPAEGGAEPSVASGSRHVVESPARGPRVPAVLPNERIRRLSDVPPNSTSPWSRARSRSGAGCSRRFAAASIPTRFATTSSRSRTRSSDSSKS